jgi:hypothetical protein
MADAKSRFKRPERLATPEPGADAERFVHGTDQMPEGQRAETTTQPEAAHQVDKVKPKKVPQKRLTIDIPLSLHKRVKSQCGAQGTTIADVIRHYLEKKFPETKTP